MRKNILEILFYVILLLILAFGYIPFLYLCRDYVSQLVVENTTSFFSVTNFVITVIYLSLFLIPFIILFFITKRLFNLPDSILSAICYSIIGLILLFIFLILRVHSYYFSPDIADVLFFLPIGKLGDSISNNNVISLLLKLPFAFLLLYYFLIHQFSFLAFIYIFYKNKAKSKNFGQTISLFFICVFSYLFVDFTYEFSNDVFINGVNFNDSLIYYWIFISAVILFVYFKYLAPFITILFLSGFTTDEEWLDEKWLSNKSYLVKINFIYILCILLLNICLKKTLDPQLSNIPTAYRDEILKTDEELEFQEDE